MNTPLLRPLLLLAAPAALLLLALLLPPLAQPVAYHDFADQRACFGVPNCLDTLSNLPISLAGVAGLWFLAGAGGRRCFTELREAGFYRGFFMAVLLVGLASGYYHLAPDHAGLAWDRAAIMLAFMIWFAAMLAERIDLRTGLLLLPLLLAAGLGSVGYWYWSETQGSGDLRFYVLMQLLPILCVPLLLWLYPARYSGDGDVLLVIGLYLLALLCDLSDRPVFALTGGLVSGHTLKHVIAALAALWVVRYLQRRKAR